VRNIIRFNSEDQLRWYDRVSFTTADTKRQTYKVGDFGEMAGNTKVRILQLAVVRFQRRRYLFFLGSPLRHTQLEDAILQLDIYAMKGELVVFGLPGLQEGRDYWVDAPLNGPWMDVDDSDRDGVAEKDFFLHVPWRLDYM